MFKKLLSLMTVMTFMFSMNAGAQIIRSAYGQEDQGYSSENITKTSALDTKNNEFWIGYWDGMINYNTITQGMGKTPMDYSLAIGYPKGTAMLSGLSVEGIKFSLSGSKHITDLKIWISTVLPSTPEQADILCQEVTDFTNLNNSADPFNEVRFNKPYKCDTSKDLYVGYSFKIKEGKGDADRYPVVVQSDAEEKPLALLINTGGGWQDYNGNRYGILATQILMSGDFKENDVKMNGNLGSHVGAKGQFMLPLEVENIGTNGIESLTVNAEVNGVKTECDIKPDKKITGIGTRYAFKAPINMPESTGRFDFNANITKVNGVALSAPVSAKGDITVVTREVKHRVVVEEFSGMWCGECPRGMVGLDKLKQVYGNDVVLMSIHSKDPLTCKDYATIVKNNKFGYPNAHLDRTLMGIDPYKGTDGSMFGIKQDIEKCAAILPVADIEVRYALDGDILKATSDVKFLYSGSASDYAMTYVLIENGLQDESWTQENYYAMYKGQGIEDIEPLFGFWVNSDTQAKGMVYNDIAIAAMGIDSGIDGSIPEVVEEESVYSNSVEFDLSSYKAIQNRDEICLAAILIDRTTGKFVNANSVQLVNTGIEGIESDSDRVTEVTRYTADGYRINAPQKGINIIKFSDGTFKKIIVK